MWTLFPYTTLFRSPGLRVAGVATLAGAAVAAGAAGAAAELEVTTAGSISSAWLAAVNTSRATVARVFI
jgi:hypothetical protein